jgi:hypothetical protein
LSLGLTIAELAKLSGANPRSVQHWAASGVLLAVPFTSGKGTGTPRLFIPTEAVIACIMAQLVERQMTIGEMKRISEGVRSMLLYPVGGGYRHTRQITEGKQYWLLDFGPNVPPERNAMVIVRDGQSVEAAIEKQGSGPVNLLIDLTAILTPLKYLNLF